MFRKAIKGLIVSTAIAILPILGNINMLYTPHIWILFCIGFLASILQPDYGLVKDNAKSKDKGTEIHIMWGIFITQLLAILEAAYIRYPDSVRWDILAVIALIIMILGLILRTWSIYTLGQYFTMHLDIQKRHKIIRSGPYKYIRHPSYAGAFMTYIAAPVFLHSWYSVIIALIILSIVWLRRIHYEDKMLMEELGEEYIAYCNTVKRIIPWIW